MDPNLALAALIIALALFNWWHAKIIAQRVALAVEIATRIQNEKLAEIYKVADGRFSDALQTIEDLKALLLESRPPDDPRIQQAIKKNS